MTMKNKKKYVYIVVHVNRDLMLIEATFTKPGPAHKLANSLKRYPNTAWVHRIQLCEDYEEWENEALYSEAVGGYHEEHEENLHEIQILAYQFYDKRVSLNLSMREVAEANGVDITVISDMGIGKIRPNFEYLKKALQKRNQK